MEFIDNSGHIFSLPSYNENPIGYEYDEQPYIFWLSNDDYERLSINNYYIKPIYLLYHIEENVESIEDIKDKMNIEIYFNNTSIYKLLSPIKIQDKISNIDTLNDYIDFDIDNEDLVKDKLTKDDIYCISTVETINNIDYNFVLIPIYVLGNATEEGTWMTNLMIYIDYDNNESWCPITVGGLFVDEYEELIINGKNLGVNLPKDILKAVYQESLFNDEFNVELYNQKLKEYLLNYSGIKMELGNYNSVIQSLNWFGYGNKIVLSKLMKTDNDIMSQYVRDYFYTTDDILRSFRKFKNDSLISLTIMTNKELDETNGIDFESYFHGEDKPKLVDLKTYNELVEVNNHNMPIENDIEKYYYWKPYFDFSIVELGLKLTCLKYYYKKYFLPMHLSIHTASLSERVFANDMKLVMSSSYGYTVPLVMTYNENNDIEFLGNGIHYFTKQIHYVDDNFNEYDQLYMLHNSNEIYYELNDTCINIPINFKEPNKIYNCILLFERVNKYQNDLLFESHFSFYNEGSSYKNFIVYPKKLNIKNLVESKYFEYWINTDFRIELCVNGKWYSYDFKSRICRPVLDFGVLKYKYYFRSIKDVLGQSVSDDEYKHSLLMLSKDDNTTNLNINVDSLDINYDHEDLYELLNVNDDLSVIIPNDTLNEEYNDIVNYGNFNKFNQISNISDNKINFNAYMHEHSLVEVNNINYDIDIYKILKYNLKNNLQYIDGELLNDEFYSYIEYYDELKNDDTRLDEYFNDIKNNVYGLCLYELVNNHYIKCYVKKINNKLSICDEQLHYIKDWEDEQLYLRYEIVIHKDLVRKNFSVDNLYLSNLRNTLIYSYSGEVFILQENDVNSDTYEIITNNEGLLMSETDLDPFFILLESLEFNYDAINNQYILNEKRYDIYDKLYQNIDHIMDRYSYNVNLINSDKYLNSIHLFNIYNRNYRLTNALSINKNADINVNGINFKFVTKDKDIIDSDYINIKNLLNDTVYSSELKISGHINRGIIDADSRYPDVYGLYWDKYFEDTDNGTIVFNKIYRDDYNKEYRIEYDESTNKKVLKEYENNTIQKTYDIKENINSNIEIFNISNINGGEGSYTFIIKNGKYYINITNNENENNQSKLITHILTNINDHLELHQFIIDISVGYQEKYSIYHDLNTNEYFQYIIKDNNLSKTKLNDISNGTINNGDNRSIFIRFNKKLEISKIDDTLDDFRSWGNWGLYVRRELIIEHNENEQDKIIGLEELTGDDNYVINEYEEQKDTYQTLLGEFRFETLDDLYNGNCKKYPDNFYGELIFEKDEENQYQSKYYWEDSNLYTIGGDDELYKYELTFTIQYAKKNELGDYVLHNFTAEQLYNGGYDYLVINFYYYKVHNIKNKFYSLDEFVTSKHVNAIKTDDGYFIKDTEGNPTDNKIMYSVEDETGESFINWTDDNGYHKVYIVRVSNICRYINRWGDEIKLQNPSGYWLNLDAVKEGFSIDKYATELRRYWFKENEDSTKGDTLEEIRNSLQTYKEKLEASSDPNNPDSTYGLNLEDRLELRYRYKNYISKYYTGAKGRFKIDWEYKTELEEKDKIFNLCVCITKKDNTIKIYNENKSEFELQGDEIEVVAYFRLDTKGKKDGSEIVPFIIKPRILVLSEEDSRFEYDYTTSGNEFTVNIGSKEYKYGDNSSEEIIDLYSQFFEYKWKLYDLYVDESNTLQKKLLYSIYDCKDKINISNNNSYDFYLMHDDQYWYGLYISKNTCDNMKLEDILIDKSKKELKLNNDYTLKYERSGKEFLINRMKYVSKNGINHFRTDDVIAARICNNDRLPTRLDISTKWNIYPVSLGMDTSNSFESNAEMTILSLPTYDNKHQPGYYKTTVRYSLDRDLQHQFKDSGTIRIS